MSRCQQWPHDVRCEREAEGYIIQPDGKRNPGGLSCRPCADAPIQEYAEKLGETWAFEPLTGVES